MPGPDPYDQLAYLALPHLETHPDRLCVVARLRGVAAAAPEGARILELGCASGANLVPLAAQLPNAELVGVEASEHQAGAASQTIAAAGLCNVAVHHLDLRKIDSTLGTFDYVIAHGVYSWIPEDAREAMLRAIRVILRPGGVAYVSYNVLPGWHLLGPARDLTRWHTRSLTDPIEICAEARRVLRFVADGTSDRADYRAALRDAAALLESKPDRYLFHDHLAPHNRAFQFHEIVRRLHAADLAFLAEALEHAMLVDALHPEVRAHLAELAADVVAAEQYRDYLTRRAFRRSLVVRGDESFDLEIDWRRALELYVAAPVQWVGDLDLAPGVPVRFTGHGEGAFESDDPAVKAMCAAIAGAWPNAVPVGALGDDELACATVLRLFALDLVELLPRPRPVVATVSARPVVCPLARLMARRGDASVTSRLHVAFPLNDLSRAIVERLDGSRTVGHLVRDLGPELLARELAVEAAAYASTDPQRARDLVVARVAPLLVSLARSGLLVG